QVMMALYRRAVTGEGSKIALSMFQSAVSWMISPVMLWQSFGVESKRHGNDHQFFAPVSVFPTADGYVYLAVGNERQWRALTQLPGFEALARPEYERNAGRIAAREQLKQELTAVTRTLPTDDLITQFNQIGVPVSRVNQMAEVTADPLIADKMIHAQDPKTGTKIAIAPPPVISAHLRQQGMQLPFPPRLGEHNEAVFGALGWDTAVLQEKNII
ncbi:MAG: CoA transferase, partial [Anaerolineae bacterium]